MSVYADAADARDLSITNHIDRAVYWLASLHHLPREKVIQDLLSYARGSGQQYCATAILTILDAHEAWRLSMSELGDRIEAFQETEREEEEERRARRAIVDVLNAEGEG